MFIKLQIEPLIDIMEIENDYKCELTKQNNIDVEGIYTKCDIKLASTFKMHWYSNLNDVSLNPILQKYTNLKFELHMEPLLSLVTNCEYRNGIRKLRASSDIFEADTPTPSPQPHLNDGLCSVFVLIEDEAHF